MKQGDQPEDDPRHEEERLLMGHRNRALSSGVTMAPLERLFTDSRTDQP